jgi:hypothetical protein
MNSLVLRTKDTNTLICFGPCNGSYDPGTPSGTYQNIEDYDAVLQEWMAAHPKPIDKRTILLANQLVPQWFKDYIS